MSAVVFDVADQSRPSGKERVAAEIKVLRPVVGWSPENFAREQIRGLVRQIFTSSASQSTRQVVFSATEPETDISGICMRVGDALAAETRRDVAIVGFPEIVFDSEPHPSSEYRERSRYTPLRLIARQVQPNLWVVPADEGTERRSTAFLHSYLGEVRREFEYSIVQSRSAGESHEAAAMAQFADGIILVLSAQRTRRAAASKIKQSLEEAQVRLLGAVLSDREFPLPEGIYRRL